MFDRPLALRQEGPVLAIVGVVDEGSIAGLRARLASMVEEFPVLTVDLSDVDFLPSAGIGVLVRARAAARQAGREVSFVAAERSPAQQVLTITGIPHRTAPASERRASARTDPAV